MNKIENSITQDLIKKTFEKMGEYQKAKEKYNSVKEIYNSQEGIELV